MRSTAILVLSVTTVLPSLAWAQRGADSTRTDTTRLRSVSIIEQVGGVAPVAGSWQVINADRLTRDRVFTLNEALRKVSGVHVRDEEGFGLRPNIGIRGLNPTRSTKVLLLEDGVPVMIAPYGDNASYYHPPVERMERVEVLKGSGQILHGPHTVGGVINYLTPAIPSRPGGAASFTAGSRGAVNAHLRAGGTWSGAGLLADLMRKESQGARENTFSQVDDATLKLRVPVAARQAVTVKLNGYREESNVTYSGLTEAEWAADPRQNPFVNDRFDISRFGGAVTHAAERGELAITTVAYGHLISRDWWRQSSNSTQRPNDRSDPACGGMANLSTACGNEGRLRSYRVGGIEPRLAWTRPGRSVRLRVDAGVRAHREIQERRQVNGAFPDSRTEGPPANPNSGLVEDNRRTTDAFSGFAHVRLDGGRWSLAPGLRVERIEIGRVNRRPVTGAARGVRGDTTLTEVIPGVGATLTPHRAVELFAGVHRGFSPPRPEDIISNTTGGAVELDPESSVNVELGARWRPGAGIAIDLTAFRMDFENQVIPASVAGGTGATLTNAGRSLHQGLELDLSITRSVGAAWIPRLSAAVTALPTARFEGERFAFIGTGGSDVVGRVYAEQNAGGTRTRRSVTGNRLPYAPELLATVGVGVRHARGFDVGVEVVHIGEQFGDAANTRVTVADGQQGTIPAATIVNATAAWSFGPRGVTAFATVKNLADQLVLVDRVRGMVPMLPRLVQAGLRTDF